VSQKFTGGESSGFLSAFPHGAKSSGQAQTGRQNPDEATIGDERAGGMKGDCGSPGIIGNGFENSDVACEF